MKHLAYWLLVLAPITVAIHFLLPAQQILIFILSVATLIPLARVPSDATAQLASRTGQTLGADRERESDRANRKMQLGGQLAAGGRPGGESACNQGIDRGRGGGRGMGM